MEIRKTMKWKILYISIMVLLIISAFYVGKYSNKHDNINLNAVVDYVPTDNGILLHTVDKNGAIEGHVLNIPCGIWKWEEKGYRGENDEQR